VETGGGQRGSGRLVPGLEQRLSEMIAQLRAAEGVRENEVCQWDPPDRQNDGSTTFPHANYLSPMGEFWALCRDLGLANGFGDYVAWMQPYKMEPFNWIEAASWQEIDRSLFAIWRQDRFSRGLWDDMVSGGTFLRLLERVRAINENQS
jgi:hypothetical protein